MNERDKNGTDATAVALSSSSLKVVVLGNEGVGKTNLIHRLIGEPPSGSVGNKNESLLSEEAAAVGLNIYDWQLPQGQQQPYPQQKQLNHLSVWDFTGQQSFHSVQEIFFSPQTLYVVVWDMAARKIEQTEQHRTCTGNTAGAGNGNDCGGGNGSSSVSAASSSGCGGGCSGAPLATSSSSSSLSCGGNATPHSSVAAGIPAAATTAAAHNRYNSTSSSMSAFKLGYDSDSDSDDDCDMDLYNQEEIRRAKRALDQDIDQKVQFWIDRVQARVPGATILPVATFADHFWIMNNEGSCTCSSISKEAKKRCKSLKERLLSNEDIRVQDLKQRLTKRGAEDWKSDRHRATCRWIDSLSSRPRILFGSTQDDGQVLPHQVCALHETSCQGLREFLLSTARGLVSNQEELEHQGPQYSPPALPALVARASLRDACRKLKNQFKILQVDYFADHVPELKHEEAFPAALKSLHNAGEISYFAGGENHPGFVVLDPIWFVECVDCILRCALTGSSDSHAASCPSMKSQEIRNSWMSQLCKQQSLDTLSGEQVHGFLTSLLIDHEIFVPLAFDKETNEKKFLLPSLLWHQKLHASSLMSDAVAKDSFSNSLCHGLVFMDSIPPTLVDRIMVHTIKMLGQSVDECTELAGVTVKEFHCWKDSCHINLGIAVDGEKESTVKVQNFLLRAPDANGSSSCPIVCYQSMFVSCFQGSQDAKRCPQWDKICFHLQRAMQNALDELPGLEYRHEGVCPECLTKKSVGEVGTWSFAKVRSAIHDEETAIRCRHGHCVETKLVQGLIQCQLDTPDSSNSPCCGILSGSNPSLPTVHYTGQPSLALPSASSDSYNGIPLPEETKLVEGPLSKVLSPVIHTGEKIKKDGVSTALSLPQAILTRPLPTMMEESSIDSFKMPSSMSHASSEGFRAEDDTYRQVKKLLDECEAGLKKRFFSRNKGYLSLDNLGLRESQIPINELHQTNLGFNLRSLSLRNNPLETISPKLVLCLPNLKSLDLSHCFIYELPNKWSLPKLKRLNLSQNLLMSFPGEAMLLGLQGLEELNLSGNKITKVRLPPHPEILNRLKVLDISMNEIRSLPRDIARLSSLKYIDVHHNPIEKVPETILSSMNNFLSKSVPMPAQNTSPKSSTRPPSAPPVNPPVDVLSNQGSKGPRKWRLRYSSAASGGSCSSNGSQEEAKDRPSLKGKQISLTRVTQNTVPVEDYSEQFLV